MQKFHLSALTLKLNTLRQLKITLQNELSTFFVKNSIKNDLIRRLSNSTTDLQHWNYLSMNRIEFCANQINCPRHTMNLAMIGQVNQIVVKVCFKLFFLV